MNREELAKEKTREELIEEARALILRATDEQIKTALEKALEVNA